jgi:sec-independent protein translocase protein TatA
MLGFLSLWELLPIVFLVLLLYGAKRLPELGRSLGRGMREFKDGVTGGKSEGGAPRTEIAASSTDDRGAVETPEERANA